MAKRVRIGMLISALPAGGAERVAVEVACALDRSRFAPFFVLTREGGPLEEPLREAGIPYTILGRRGRWIPIRTMIRAHRLLRDADIIHAHLFSSSMYGALLARTTGVPLVTRDPTWDGRRTLVRTWGYRWWISPRARYIVCPSDLVARSIEEEGVPRRKLRVIVNGVPTGTALTRREARAELGLSADEWVIGIIATLRVEKAHEVLLRAFARLLREGRVPTLCIVGDGPQKTFLHDVAEELGLDGRVVWAGHRRDARRLARAFDTAVICSSWEGLPLAALEILAAGTPLVATRVGVLPRILDRGVGLLVDVDDDAGLARALARLMDEPARAAEQSVRGLRAVEDDYSFDRMIKEFTALYDEVLDPQQGARGDVRSTRRAS
ncbi:MAG: glycosyltransferase [Gaiella sp.]|nr:glycosyltransferase [Gaiella sp.]